MQEHFPLKKFNSFKLDIKSRFFIQISSVDQLRAFIKSDTFKSNRPAVIGGGSNVLFSDDFEGIVIKINIEGTRIYRENQKHVYLEISSGEDWPQMVERVVAEGWGGIENLAMIPGTAGAAPIQNIAGYGHNLNERLVSVDALNLKNGKVSRFSVEDCKLGYRDSIFKKELKNQFVVTKIRLKLDKNPTLNTSYRSRYESVEEELAGIAEKPYKIRDVYNAICNIRKRKLPDISVIGSAGSVFKNPVVSSFQYRKLQKLCPGLHFYPVGNLSYHHIGNRKANSCEPEIPEKVKIPAAWLIENMGWAGKRIGDCGVWKTQPLNIVNYGGATPKELCDFIALVKKKVFESYGVFIEEEIVII